MSRIECTVSNCSHNKRNNCYANRVNVGGKSADNNEQTCCGSFLNRLLYSDLTNNVFSGGSCDSLICYVKSCKHNCNSLCEMEQIQIAGIDASMYDKTTCESFELE
jgi:hypothetical protein